MLIIIEGPDKQGKTELAKYLSKKLNLSYRHAGPPVDGFDGYLKELKQVVKSKRGTVMDRSFIGELVYGPILRDKSCIDPVQFGVLCGVAKRIPVLVIYAQQRQIVAEKWFSKETYISKHVQAIATRRFYQVITGVVAPVLPTIAYAASTVIERKRWFAINSALIGNLKFKESSK